MGQNRQQSKGVRYERNFFKTRAVCSTIRRCTIPLCSCPCWGASLRLSGIVRARSPWGQVFVSQAWRRLVRSGVRFWLLVRRPCASVYCAVPSGGLARAARVAFCLAFPASHPSATLYMNSFSWTPFPGCIDRRENCNQEKMPSGAKNSKRRAMLQNCPHQYSDGGFVTKGPIKRIWPQIHRSLPTEIGAR